jgi:hypothetical protein
MEWQGRDVVEAKSDGSRDGGERIWMGRDVIDMLSGAARVWPGAACVWSGGWIRCDGGWLAKRQERVRLDYLTAALQIGISGLHKARPQLTPTIHREP